MMMMMMMMSNALTGALRSLVAVAGLALCTSYVTEDELRAAEIPLKDFGVGDAEGLTYCSTHKMFWVGDDGPFVGGVWGFSASGMLHDHILPSDVSAESVFNGELETVACKGKILYVVNTVQNPDEDRQKIYKIKTRGSGFDQVLSSHAIEPNNEVAFKSMVWIGSNLFVADKKGKIRRYNFGQEEFTKQNGKLREYYDSPGTITGMTYDSSTKHLYLLTRGAGGKKIRKVNWPDRKEVGTLAVPSINVAKGLQLKGSTLYAVDGASDVIRMFNKSDVVD